MSDAQCSPATAIWLLTSDSWIQTTPSVLPPRPVSAFTISTFRPPFCNVAARKAIALAVEAYRGQKDRAGKPYILHPLRVMHRVQTEDEQIVAILHDVVEDTPWTPEKLAAEGFPQHILDALDCVTKREGESYEQFAERSASNPIARRVKLADLEDDMDVRRLTKWVPAVMPPDNNG